MDIVQWNRSPVLDLFTRPRRRKAKTFSLSLIDADLYWTVALIGRKPNAAVIEKRARKRMHLIIFILLIELLVVACDCCWLILIIFEKSCVLIYDRIYICTLVLVAKES